MGLAGGALRGREPRLSGRAQGYHNIVRSPCRLAFDPIAARLKFMKMMMLLRSLLVIAALAYAAMPMHGAIAMASTNAAHTTVAAEADHLVHHHAVVIVRNMACPHDMGHVAPDTSGHSGMHGDHCNVCLTLAPATAWADVNASPRPAEAAGISRSLVSTTASPPERPPRLQT